MKTFSFMFQQRPRKTSLRKSKKAREVIFPFSTTCKTVCCGVIVPGFVFLLAIDYVCKDNFKQREKNNNYTILL